MPGIRKTVFGKRHGSCPPERVTAHPDWSEKQQAPCPNRKGAGHGAFGTGDGLLIRSKAARLPSIGLFLRAAVWYIQLGSINWNLRRCADMKLSKNDTLRLLLFVIGIMMVISLLAWGNLHQRNVDRLPPLNQIAEMTDEAELNDSITHFTKQELRIAWGAPNENSRMEDVWYINENTKLVVNYHNNDRHAVVCSIVKN